MKAIKIIAAVFIAVMLFVAECFTMGIFAVDTAISEKSIKESMKESNVITEILGEVLKEKTVNMGGRYGDMANAILHTDAMNNFLAEYLTAAINTEVYGAVYEEIANDELMNAFSEGIEEVNESGIFNITPLEEEALQLAMQQEGPDLTASLNQQVSGYDSLNGEMTSEALENSMGRIFLGLGTRIVMVLVCILLCIGLIALCWRSKLGFLWSSVIAALTSIIYGALYLIVNGAYFPSPSEQMAFFMMENGFKAVSIAGLIISVLFLAVFIAFKIIDRRKNDEEDIRITESTSQRN